MSNFNWEEATELNQLTLLKPDMDGTYPVFTFVGNEPVRSAIGKKYGKMGHTFEVKTIDGETMGLYVSSVKLMQQIKENLPIDNKTFNLSRSGFGVDIEYVLEEV